MLHFLHLLLALVQKWGSVCVVPLPSALFLVKPALLQIKTKKKNHSHPHLLEINRNEQVFNLPSHRHPSPQKQACPAVGISGAKQGADLFPLGESRWYFLIPPPWTCQQGPVELSLRPHPAITRLNEAVQRRASWHCCPSTPVSVCRTLWGPESSSHPAATRWNEVVSGGDYNKAMVTVPRFFQSHVSRA